MSNIYTINETAEILKVSRPTVKKLLDGGKLKGFKVLSVWRVSEKAIDEFIKQGGK